MTFVETKVWNPDDYETHGRFVSDLAGPVMELLAPKAGERILDLGCGDGVLTLAMQQSGVDVLGVDASPEMVAATQGRGVNAKVMSGDTLSFDNEFDAVFSSAVLHWIPDVDSVIEGVFKALKSNGRFVAEFGGFGNIAALRTAVRAAYFIVTGREMPDDGKVFPSANWYKERLEAAGFTVHEIALHDRQTPLKTGLRGWLQTFGGRFFATLNPDEIEKVITKAEALVAPELTDENGDWFADYKRLRFSAQKLNT